MKKEMIKKEIEKTAKEADCTPIEIITAMQASLEDESEMMNFLFDLKWEYIEKMDLI